MPFLCVCLRDQGDEGIVGLSYQYKDDSGNMVAISRGKVKDAKRQFAHQVQVSSRVKISMKKMR